MRSTLLCLGLLMLLSACSSGGGSGTAGAGDGTGDPTVVAKSQTRGTFTAEKESALGEYGGVPQGFDLLPAMKCGDEATYDSRLRVGDTFKNITATAHRDRLSNSDQTAVVRSVDAKHINQLITSSGIQIALSCAITPENPQQPITCDFKIVGSNTPLDPSGSKMSETCETDYTSGRFAKNVGTVALGKFKLESGQTVSAQRIVLESSNVDFKCGVGDDKKVVGTGKVITDQVETRDLVTSTASSCTPSTTVYRKVVYQLDDGTILYADVDEKTQAPQR